MASEAVKLVERLRLGDPVQPVDWLLASELVSLCDRAQRFIDVVNDLRADAPNYTRRNRFKVRLGILADCTRKLEESAAQTFERLQRYFEYRTELDEDEEGSGASENAATGLGLSGQSDREEAESGGRDLDGRSDGGSGRRVRQRGSHGDAAELEPVRENESGRGQRSEESEEIESGCGAALRSGGLGSRRAAELGDSLEQLASDCAWLLADARALISARPSVEGALEFLSELEARFSPEALEENRAGSRRRLSDALVDAVGEVDA